MVVRAFCKAQNVVVASSAHVLGNCAKWSIRHEIKFISGQSAE